MNARDARLLRSTWEPDLSIIDDLDSPTQTRRRARTARLGSGVTVAVVAIMVFLAGVALGPRLQHGGPPAAVVSAAGPATGVDPMPAIPGALDDDGWAGGPGPGATLGSAAATRAATGRHPRPQEILTLPWQIQDRLRQAPPGDVDQAPNTAVEPAPQQVDFRVQKRWELADTLWWQAERAWQAGDFRAAAAFSRQSWAVMPDVPPLDAARAQRWAIADRLQHAGNAAWHAGAVRHAASLYRQSQAVFPR